MTITLEIKNLIHEIDEHYAEVFNHMIEGIQIIDKEYRYLFLNDAAVVQSRSSREKLLGYTMMERYPGIEKTSVFAQIKTCMENRVSKYSENEFEFPDGAKGWYEVRIEPIPYGVLIMSLDITERKKTEDKLLEQIRQCKEQHTQAQPQATPSKQ